MCPTGIWFYDSAISGAASNLYFRNDPSVGNGNLKAQRFFDEIRKKVVTPTSDQNLSVTQNFIFSFHILFTHY